MLCYTAGSIAQNEAVVYGYITDVKTGENLPGATIFNIRNYKAVSSNNYGYSIHFQK